MTQYLGFDVLEATPNRDADISRKSTVKLTVVASTVGARRVTDKRGVPIITMPLNLFASSPDDIGYLRAFIAARRGRVVPFWLESQKVDVVLASAAQAGDMSLTIRETGYTLNQYKGKRRHLVIGDQRVRITGAVVNGNGTETLQLASQLQKPLAAGTGLSFLLLCRLADDEVSFNYASPGVVELSITAVELPHETP